MLQKMLQKMHVKHTNTPKTPTQLPRCGQNNENNKKTHLHLWELSMAIAPHMCVGRMSILLGLGVGVGHFIFTVILVHVVRIQ